MTGTWHYGLIARWWAEVNRPDADELDYLRDAVLRYGQPALDLGCGTGRLLIPLLAEGLDVDGTDVSADMLQFAAAAGADSGLDMAGRLACQAFDELDRERSYGTIFSIGAFAIGGSMARDAVALQRIREHLQPGGAAILSYEVISDADHAVLSHPARYPLPWPDEGARATLADGDELELLTRAVGYDTTSRTHDLEILARLRRGGSIVEEQTGRLLNTYYRPPDLEGMLRRAGFTEVVVEGPYTGRPPETGDTTLVLVAR